MTPLVSVVIPTYNHAAFLPDAIRSALEQEGVPNVEVIVVDDGSTDETWGLLALPRMVGIVGDHLSVSTRLRVIHQGHAGPSAARNAGIEAACGEYVMFLDADDIIAPNKLAKQLEAFTPEVGFVLCDVSIEDESRGRTVLASEQYGYADRGLSGWIADQLASQNFIPIMSPLVRRSMLEGIRFNDALVPEDWHFWHAVAQAGRVAYVPEVLATYRHRKTGRSRLPKPSRGVYPNLELPLRLNLGCGRPGARSWHPIKGFVNLDKSLGWTFEDGLGDFADHTVAGLSISHALMYVAEEHWPFVFGEFARVLVDGGVVRITEDDAISPESSRCGGWKGSEPAVSLTSATKIRVALERAGLSSQELTAETTLYADGSLKQAQHGFPPDVFFVEGVRPASVLFSPHCDDETLFAAGTILKYRPRIVTCFGSGGDYGDTAVRQAETRSAMEILGAAGVEHWDGGDMVAKMREFDARSRPSRVWAPHEQASHPDHVAVAKAAREVFGGRLRTYHTYDAYGKVRQGVHVEFEPAWVLAKLRALARYETQVLHPRACQFFTEDLREYVG